MTVYTTPTCPWCDKVKEWLKQHNIKFKEIDVSVDEESAKKMIEKTGQMGVPITESNGQFVIGFDVDKLKKLFNIKE